MEPVTYKHFLEINIKNPSIGDRLDMLWHSMDSGEIQMSTEFYETLKKVKEKYPKSEAAQ